MICGTCHGNGYVRRPQSETTALSHPCPECDGSGITSCCEGPVPCDETAKDKTE